MGFTKKKIFNQPFESNDTAKSSEGKTKCKASVSVSEIDARLFLNSFVHR